MSCGEVTEWRSFGDRIDVDHQKRFFDDRGYVRLEGFLKPEEIDDINLHLQDYRQSIIPLISPQFVFYEDKENPDSIIRLERMLWHNQYFKALADSPAFNGLAELLLGVPCRTDNVQWFSKPPGAKETPPHQV